MQYFKTFFSVRITGNLRFIFLTLWNRLTCYGSNHSINYFSCNVKDVCLKVFTPSWFMQVIQKEQMQTPVCFEDYVILDKVTMKVKVTLNMKAQVKVTKECANVN